MVTWVVKTNNQFSNMGGCFEPPVHSSDLSISHRWIENSIIYLIWGCKAKDRFTLILVKLVFFQKKQ
jgi:hypothetical protein